MKPFQKILVATDFSRHSALAQQVAADLSRRFDAPLTLTHVYEPVAYALPEAYQLFTEPQLGQLFAAFEKQLAEQKQAALAAGALRVETHLATGVAASEICALAERGGFDLIVLGTHGRRGLSHVILGSVAERVVRTAPCPVLTVRDKD